jgi:hypothetical protein
LRTLDDRVALARRLEERAKASSLDNVARSWANTRRAAEEEGKTVRAAIKHAEAIASDAIREKETAG